MAALIMMRRVALSTLLLAHLFVSLLLTYLIATDIDGEANLTHYLYFFALNPPAVMAFLALVPLDFAIRAIYPHGGLSITAANLAGVILCHFLYEHLLLRRFDYTDGIGVRLGWLRNASGKPPD